MCQESIALLRGWVAGYTEQLDTVNLHHIVDKARAALPPSGGDIDGVAVSRALRTAGFNRDYEAADKNIMVYKRSRPR